MTSNDANCGSRTSSDNTENTQVFIRIQHRLNAPLQYILQGFIEVGCIWYYKHSI